MTPEYFSMILGYLSPVVVAWLGYKGARWGIARYKRTKASGEVEEDDNFIAYENDPRKFVEDVLKDNADKSDEVRQLREDQTALWSQLDALRKEFNALRAELDAQKRNENLFRDALGRWLTSIFGSWGKANEIPMPSSHDFELLRPFVPSK